MSPAAASSITEPTKKFIPKGAPVARGSNPILLGLRALRF
jgi:hypothetical protein